MKYIITKDGIFEVYTDDLNPNEEIDIEIAGFRAKYCRGLGKPISKEEIIKVADTIEELCDCFIGKVSDEEYIHLIGLWERKNYPAIKEIYGAVWCEWGLKYVARMNSKGEMELL